ncbi:MAG: ABC transporter ATP-binding protein [Desulfomonilaceae bacterium]
MDASEVDTNRGLRSVFLEVINLEKRFAMNGSEVLVLQDINLSCSREDLLCILGPSGCGKTTLLNLIAGFTVPSGGEIILEGHPLGPPGPDRCVVFQEDALFPWLTVWENVAFGLQNKLKDHKALSRRVDRFLSLVGLDRFGSYLPREISLGMKQRVSLARVLILEPMILLMDEPFASLDAQTRQEMNELLLNIWTETCQTILFVTHDVEEALRLANTVFVFDRNPGRIRECIRIPLARPRLSESPDFLALKRSLCDTIFSC